MLLSTQDAEKNREYLLNGLIATGAGFVGLTAILGLAALYGAGRVYDAFVLCMYALAAFSVGGLIGFIFGIPRSLQHLPKARRMDSQKTLTRSFLKVKAVTISEIKQMLHDLKCYFGNIDDVFDDALIEAIQAFQEGEGLPTDGILAISTYTHLKNRTEGG